MNNSRVKEEGGPKKHGYATAKNREKEQNVGGRRRKDAVRNSVSKREGDDLGKTWYYSPQKLRKK